MTWEGEILRCEILRCEILRCAQNDTRRDQDDIKEELMMILKRGQDDNEREVHNKKPGWYMMFASYNTRVYV